MAEVTVKQLAEVVGTPVEKLLVQLKDAGLEKSGADALISNDEKMQLLASLRKAHGTSANAAASERKITLRRKKVSEIKVGSGAKKTVNVEVRGKRTYVKRNAALQQAEEEKQRALLEAKEKAENEARELEQKRLAAEEAKRAEDEAKARHREEEQREREAQLAREQEELRLKAEQEKAERERREAEEAKLRQEEEARQLEEQRRREEESRRQQQPNQLAGTDSPKRDDDVSASERDNEVRGSHKEDKMHAKAEPKRNSNTRSNFSAPGNSSSNSAGKGRGNDNKGGGKRGAKGASSSPAGAGRPGKGGKGGKRGGAAGGRRRGGPQHHQMETKHGFAKPSAPVIHEVTIPETITVAELANKMAVKAAEVIKAMMKMGVMATINQVLDQDTAVLVVEEMGHTPVMQSANDVEIELTKKIAGDTEGDMQSRPPVVTVMGHVDHGKTSLLDHIRRTRVAAGEAGGITQHIGAYHVETDHGVITFLDTPGHAAFTAMRARGAQSTDIVVLVVAGDDGVMPQTKEAIQHAQAAGVPLVVAVNKMDKPEADFDRVTNELSQHNVMPEEWGGEHIFVKVSAHTGDGIDALLEAILLQSEVLELTAPAKGSARGTVIEASLDKGRGPVATVLVQKGELEKGQIVVCGSEFGRVRAMFDEGGNPVLTAGPSIPVQILGLSSVPDAGDEMLVAKDERDARELASFRQQRERDARLAERKPAKLDDVFSQIRAGDVATLNLLIKADVQGSYEALRDSLERLSNDEITIRIIGGGVGGINESDASLAAASNAILIGFNVRADNAARRVIQEQEVDLHYYSVIYDVIDLVKAAGSGMLSPDIVERIIGVAEVKDVFKSPKFGAVAGSMVIEGTVRRQEPIRVLRDNIVIYEGELESLRRYKDDVNEVRMGTECGIAVKNYNDVRAGDKIEVYERKEVARTL